MARTTADLLTSVKRRAQLPDDSGTLSDSDILAFATDELQNVIAPRLIATSEWHYAFTYSETVSSVRTYRLNPRVSGNRIISVEYDDGTSSRFIPLRHPLTQNRPGMGAEDYSIFGNKITLSDGCPTSGTLNIRAFTRPSALVTSGCTAITSANATTEQLTVTSSASFSTSQLIDVVYAQSPYELYGTIVINGISFSTIDSVDDATHITLADDVVDTAFVSDANNQRLRLCPAEQSDRVMLPDELHDYLAQRTAIRCMEARGFTQDMQNHLRKLADLEMSFDKLTTPRSKGEFKAIVSEDYFYSGRP